MSDLKEEDLANPVVPPLVVSDPRSENSLLYQSSGMSGQFDLGGFIEHDHSYLYDSLPSVVASPINTFGQFQQFSAHNNNASEELLHALSGTYSSQVLLGIVAFSEQPKPTARHLVSQLHASGIRFVYFSPDSERLTHAFGSSLGQFTGFNHYISLRPPMDTDKEEQYLGSSLLPRGVLPLRIHIDFIDNVPLLVSLLSDSGPDTIQGMLRVYGEQGEECVGFGSSQSWQFSSSFMLSALSFTIDPVLSAQCKHHPPVPRPVQSEEPTGEKQAVDICLSYASAVAAVLEQPSETPSSQVPPNKEQGPGSLLNCFEFGLATALTSASSTIRLPTEFTLTDFSVLFSYARSFDAAAIRAFDAMLVTLSTIILTNVIAEVSDMGAILSVSAQLLLCFVCLPLLITSLVLIPKDPASIDHIVNPRADLEVSTSKVKKCLLFICTLSLPAALAVNVFYYLLIRGITIDQTIQHSNPVTLLSGHAVQTDSSLTIAAQDYLFWASPPPVYLGTLGGPIPIAHSFLINSITQSKQVRLARTISTLVLWTFFLGITLVMGLRSSDVSKKTRLALKSRLAPLYLHSKCLFAFKSFPLFLPQWKNLAMFGTGLILLQSLPSFFLGTLDVSLFLLFLIPGTIVTLFLQWELGCRVIQRNLRKEDAERQITFFQFDTQLGMHSPVGH